MRHITRLGFDHGVECFAFALGSSAISPCSAIALKLDGSSTDLGRLIIATESLIKLLPNRELPAPAEQHGDPRLVMWQLYKQMRERGEIGLKALPPEGGHQHRIAELEAENEALRARLAGKTLDVVERLPRGGSTAIDPAEADITPPGEIGSECYAGIRPGPDDPPRRSPPVIEGRAVPNPPAAAGYDYNANQDWKNFVEPDGSIRTTPHGHYWGLYDPGMHHYPRGR